MRLRHVIICKLSRIIRLLTQCFVIIKIEVLSQQFQTFESVLERERAFVPLIPPFDSPFDHHFNFRGLILDLYDVYCLLILTLVSFWCLDTYCVHLCVLHFCSINLDRILVRTWLVYQARLRFLISPLLKEVMARCCLTFMQVSVNFDRTMLVMDTLI